jgi:nucleoside-diphosphate-sugar epimerase
LIVRVGQAMGAWPAREIVVDRGRFRPGTSEIQRLGVDYAAFHQATGWQPEYSREEALQATIAYYRDTRDRWFGMQDW